MNERVLNILGFDVIRARLAEKAASPLARELAVNIAPSADGGEVERLLKETAEAESITLSSLSTPIISFDDVSAELTRLKTGASLSCAELLRMCRLLKAAKRAAHGIKRDEAGALTLLPNTAAGLFYDDAATGRIDEAIAGEDEVADGASAELRGIRRRIASENSGIREKLNGLIHSRDNAKYLQDAIITMRNGRYVVPVKQEHRASVAGMVHDESQSGATLFVEPAAVIEANNRLRSLEAEEKREIERILASLSAMLRPFADDIRADMDILAHLDLVFARAALGISMKARAAARSEGRSIDIRRGRHPLIDEKKVIPVSLKMDEGTSCLIITGPNTGGKTVTLKLAGLFAVMNQCGLMVPADEGTALPIFSGVFADIGDEQSIEQSLSTFSAHMKNIIYILRRAEPDALVLIDELGAGTDPEEGTALALAILDALSGRGVKLLATTHYGEIKAYAMSAPGFMNAGMEFDPNSLMPTYRLMMGVAGASNAFLVSKRLGLKSDIIARAKEFMNEERLEFDSLMAEAEKTRRKAENELQRAKEMQIHAKEIDKKAKKLEDDLEQKRQSMMKKAQEDAYEIVRSAQDEAEEIIKELKKLEKVSGPQATKTVEKARRQLSAKKDVISARMKEQKKPQKGKIMKPQEILPGTGVRIISLGADATVLAPPDAKGMVALQAGIMKLSLHMSDLERGADAAAKKGVRTSRVSLERKAVPLSINLHGMTVEEALVEVDKYLDDAFVAGLTEVSIVHGKGTGVLRSGVQSFLRRHPHVASFRLGKYGEGEAGVTVVTLK